MPYSRHKVSLARFLLVLDQGCVRAKKTSQRALWCEIEVWLVLENWFEKTFKVVPHRAIQFARVSL